MDKYKALKKYFGYDSFRGGQETIVDCLLSDWDALCVMPTGAGKSICYQLPAILKPGTALVISPLISLMKDQVNTLEQAGVKCAYLNSSLTGSAYFETLNRARRGKYKVIYVAPERLVNEHFISMCQHITVSMVAVDEAHCVSQWGQDFRPGYLKICEFIENLPYRPVIGAFTATATQEVKADISRLLKLKSPMEITTGFDRSNLYFAVEQVKNKDSALLKYLNQFGSASGIVYCISRKAVEEVCELLKRQGYRATRYHAGLSDQERRNNQEDFIYDRCTIMIATNAFGMGIDKSNVSFVIHYQMPKNIESYYQEAGRAGRDGSPANCVLLYSPGDVRTNRFLIENTEPNPELTKKEQLAVYQRDCERLKQMTYYSTTTRCLRGFILNYFGESFNGYCEHCSNCDKNLKAVDVTLESKKILSCIARTNGQYGIQMNIDILQGRQNDRIRQKGLDQLSTYGLLKDMTISQIRTIIDMLLAEGYARLSEGEYPCIGLTEKALGVFKGEVTLSAKLPLLNGQPPVPGAAAKAVQPEPDYPVDQQLLTELKALRRKLAAMSGVPAYVVFTDATLQEICRRRPHTQMEFLKVSGVGAAKQERYGKKFVELICRFDSADR